MGYHVPGTKLFSLDGDEGERFLTEYIVGSRFLDVLIRHPSYQEIRESAENWTEYFSFLGLYSLTGESDGMEILLASDRMIHRVDTTDAFLIGDYQLAMAGINQSFQGKSPSQVIQQHLESMDVSRMFSESDCDAKLKKCRELDGKNAVLHFLEPFQRIQAIPQAYIDDVLNTLCYFYPDFIGDFFKRYIRELQVQAALYAGQRGEK